MTRSPTPRVPQTYNPYVSPRRRVRPSTGAPSRHKPPSSSPELRTDAGLVSLLNRTGPGRGSGPQTPTTWAGSLGLVDCRGKTWVGGHRYGSATGSYGFGRREWTSMSCGKCLYHFSSDDERSGYYRRSLDMGFVSLPVGRGTLGWLKWMLCVRTVVGCVRVVSRTGTGPEGHLHHRLGSGVLLLPVSRSPYERHNPFRSAPGSFSVVSGPRLPFVL